MLNADKWKRPTPVFAVGDSVISLAHDGLVMEIKPYFSITTMGAIGNYQDDTFLSFELQNGRVVFSDLMPAVVPNTPAYQRIKPELVAAYKMAKLSECENEQA